MDGLIELPDATVRHCTECDTEVHFCQSIEELLAVFDRHVRDGRATISAMTDEAFARPWVLKAGGVAQLTMTKADVVRTWGLNHMIHHRGQLTVYLRLNDVPLPGIYTYN